MVGDEGVHGADAADWGVEVVEEFVRDTGGDFSTVAPAEHVFVGDEDTAGLADALGDGFPVVRREGAEVDELDVEAGLTMQFDGGLQRAGDDGAVGDDGEVFAGANDAGFAEGDGEVRPG